MKYSNLFLVFFFSASLFPMISSKAFGSKTRFVIARVVAKLSKNEFEVCLSTGGRINVSVDKALSEIEIDRKYSVWLAFNSDDYNFKNGKIISFVKEQ